MTSVAPQIEVEPASEIVAEIDRLVRGAPEWSNLRFFTEAVEVEKKTIYTVGVCSQSRFGLATGSAASLHKAPIERACFEVLERMSLLEARTKRCAWPLVYSNRKTVPAEHVFPPPGAHFRFALSNGVALHRDPDAACDAATLELVERDAVLRAWFGIGELERILPAGMDLIPTSWSSLYDFEVRRFKTTSDSSSTIRVAGVFGLPKTPAVPLVYGFAARHSLAAAIGAARDECIQRLGFLWGEEIPSTTPSASADPEFHQEYYLCPQNHGVLAEWLEHGHGTVKGEPTKKRRREPRRFADLTPSWLGKRFVVVKALPNGEIPLAFGPKQPIARGDVARYAVHPIA